MKKGYLAGLLNLVLLRHVIRLFTQHGRQPSDTQGTADSDCPRAPWHARVRAWLQVCQDWWRGCARFWQHVIINLAIGLVIEMALIAAHHVDLTALTVMEDAAMDFVMRHFNNVSLKGEDNAYVLLDIDQQTYEAWDQPFYIPREKLLKLIQFAQSGHPVVIIVDIDLSKAGDTDDDKGLSDFIQEYDSGDYPPLILMRTLKPLPIDASYTAPPLQRASFLDAEVSGSGNIMWASPHYKRDTDYRVRRWLLWQRTCKDGQPEVLVSVELLVKALLAGEDGKARGSNDARAVLDQCFTPIFFRCDADVPEESGHDSASCQIGKHSISLDPSVTAQRLIYSIPFDLPEGTKRPLVGDTELFHKWSAHEITEAKRHPQSRSLEGKVVVIGASYRETRDWYATPLGEMPGAMVIINAIHSMGVNGQLRPPGFWLKLLIVSVLIVIMSLLFARFNSFTGMVLSSVAVILLLIPLSFFFFQSGVWIDFALPLFAVQIHQIVSEFEESHAASKKRKHTG